MLKSLSGSPEWLSDTHTKKNTVKRHQSHPYIGMNFPSNYYDEKKALTTGFFDPNLSFEGVTIETS